MRKSIKKFLVMILMICIILSEWGNCGLIAKAADSSITISGASTISTLKKEMRGLVKGLLIRTMS